MKTSKPTLEQHRWHFRIRLLQDKVDWHKGVWIIYEDNGSMIECKSIHKSEHDSVIKSLRELRNNSKFALATACEQKYELELLY